MIVKQTIKNVVLVHGAFADGSGWDAVAKILKNDGYQVSVVQHPETSYADDQKYTKAAIDTLWFVQNYVFPPSHADLLSVRGTYNKQPARAEIEGLGGSVPRFGGWSPATGEPEVLADEMSRQIKAKL